MRLSQAERAAIRAAVAELDPQAKVYLYGSRTDDDLRGGDIDLLVISNSLGFAAKITLLTEIQRRLGEQKIDLLVKSEAEIAGDAFVRSILPGAVRL